MKPKKTLAEQREGEYFNSYSKNIKKKTGLNVKFSKHQTAKSDALKKKMK